MTAREQIDALLDGGLRGPRADRVRDHVRDCAECSQELAARRDLQAALRTLPAEPLPEGFELRLHRRLAAAIPERRRSRWWTAALPTATAAAGFLAAATLAAPLVTAPPASHAQMATAARAGGSAGPSAPEPIHSTTPSADQRPGGVGTFAATGAATTVMNGAAASVFDSEATTSPQPAGTFAPMQRAAGSASSTAGSSTTATSTTPAAADISSNAPSSATDPAALSLTILANQPMQAVADLSQLAAEGGGHVIATFPARPGDPSLQGSPQPVATLDALIPASAADAYARRAGNDGRILASVSSLPPAGDASTPNVRLLVTVLAAPAPAPAPQAAAPTAPAPVPPTTTDAVLRDAARVSPWAAGAAAVGILAWAGTRLLRRR